LYQSIDALQTVITRLCKDKGITVNKLATLSGITQSTIASILAGKSRNPKIETLRKLAVGYDMDYDVFIMHINSAQDEITPKPVNTKVGKFEHETGITVSRRLKELRSAKDVTLIDVYLATGVRVSYEDNFRSKDYSDLIALADYFDVSLDYLVGRSDCPDVGHKLERS